MAELARVQMEDGTIIYIEAAADINKPEAAADPVRSIEQKAVTKGGERSLEQAKKQVLQNFQAIDNTIRAYTRYTLGAFKQVAIANIDKVTLEFGIKVGGEAGIPYVTKGTAESNLKITVECSFPEKAASGAGGEEKG